MGPRARPAPRSGNAETLAVRRTRRARNGSTSSSMTKSTPYELDGGDRPPTQALEGPGRARPRSASASPRTEQPHEHRDAGPRDVGADGRRRPADAALAPAAGACCKTRSCACASADGFSHARSLAFMTRCVLVQGDHRARRPGAPRSGKTGISEVIVRDDPARRARARPASSSPPRSHQAHSAPARRTATRRSCSGSSAALITGDDAHGSARARPEPHLRRRAGPADAAEVRPRLPARGHAPALLAVLAFVCARVRHGHRRLARQRRGRPTSGRSCAGRSRSALMIAAIALLFRWSPAPPPAGAGRGSRSARRSRCCCGSLVTVGLGLFFRSSTSFGDTYGPLAGIVALLLWALLSSVVVLFGAAVAAQLEAVRAGAAEPQDEEKVAALRARRDASPRDRAAADPRRDRGPARRSQSTASTQIRAGTLEGVIGVPATEGNRIDVLRNGDEIFPAMLDAIDEAEHTIDFLTFVYWERRDRHRVRRPARRASAGAACGCACCSTRGARTRSTAPRSTRWTRPACTCAGSDRCAGSGSASQPPDAPQGADRRRGDRRSPAASASPTSGRATPATSTSGATRTSASAGPAVDGLRAAFLDNWAETDPELFDDGIDRFPDQPQAGRRRSCSACAARRRRGGATSPRCSARCCSWREQRVRITTAYFVPDAELTDRLCDAADRGVRGRRSCCPGPHADKRFVQLAGEADVRASCSSTASSSGTSSRRCCTPRS